MAPASELWVGYFYPETYDPVREDGTLRNLLGERDPGVLASKEYARTTRRQRELLSGDVDVPRTFDADHLRSIHRHLFQDVYEWAGQFRTVPIYKPEGAGFASLRDGSVERYLADARRLVEATPWEHLNRADFGERAATVFAYLNQAHPFREGNGRTSKVFMEHVAERSRFTLDYDRVSPRQWNNASALSGTDLGAYEPWPESLVPVFRAIAADRALATAAGPDTTSQTRSALSASLPAVRHRGDPQDPAQHAPGTPQRPHHTRSVPGDRTRLRGTP